MSAGYHSTQLGISLLPDTPATSDHLLLHEIKSNKGKITTESCADPAAARLRSQGLSSQQLDWRQWEGGGKSLSPDVAGLWAMGPAQPLAKPLHGKTKPCQWVVRRKDLAHLTLWAWLEASLTWVSLRSKSEAKPESEHPTNKIPAQGEEEAEGLSLKPVPVCAKGLSLDLASRGQEVSLPLFSLRCALHSHPCGLAEAPPCLCASRSDSKG